MEPIDPNITSGHLMPYWLDSHKPIFTEKLSKDIETETVIIGGGITGLTTAYMLAKAGRKCVLVEDGAIGSGESGRTTAHLTNTLDNGYREIRSMYGDEMARLAYESHTDAIDIIESNVKNENIRCNFKRVDGYLFLHPLEKEKVLDKEFEALQAIGVDAEWEEAAPLPFETGRCIKYKNQAKFHIMKYLSKLAESIQERRGKIFTQTHVQKVEKWGVRTSSGHSIKAKNIVVATDAPIKGAKIFNKMAPYRSYVIGSIIPKGKINDALYWDTGYHKDKLAHPYHYIRLSDYDSSNDLLIIGGEDHKVAQEMEAEAFLRLEEWAKDKFPFSRADYKWSGHIHETIDGLAYIGRSPWHDYKLYFATGYCGVGMTSGTIAGRLICDMILGKKNPWEQLYSPQRKSLSALRYAVAENANVVMRFIGDKFARNDMAVDSLSNGEGAIVEVCKQKLAVYRDEDGTLNSYTAICPHRKCVLKWNLAEKSFDCPCHGSRFDTKGRVLHGPAIANLEEMPLDDSKRAEFLEKSKDIAKT